jgi:hypothetical protein
MTAEHLTVLSEPCAGYHVVTLNRWIRRKLTAVAGQ